MLDVQVERESWPLRRPFVIARLTQTHSVTLKVTLQSAAARGQGESEPHESSPEVQARVEQQVRDAAGYLRAGMPYEELCDLLPLPTARNPVDCALWDLQAKSTGRPISELAGLQQPQSLVTALTIGIGTPEEMTQRARALGNCALIKVKLGSVDPVACIEAIRRVLPQQRLTVDANEAWSLAELREYAPHLARLGVALIEQPLRADADEGLLGYRSPVPLCADESCDDRRSLPQIVGRYQYVNIKLDKTGGFTEALSLARDAQQLGLGIMTGCNVATSLSMAPAFYIGQQSSFVDIDGATMLVGDREHPLRYDMRRGVVAPPARELWG